MKFNPLGDKLLVRRSEEEETPQEVLFCLDLQLKSLPKVKC